MSERREINLARRVLSRHGLAPPVVDLRSVVMHYAEVIQQKLPVDVDGATIYQPKRRPIVLINAERHGHRIRFTMAHELGHVLLPNHVGDIVDEKVGLGLGGNWLEQEANSFAAELLMPQDWVTDYVKDMSEPQKLVREISREAQVSTLAATFRITPFLPSGFIFALLEADGRVIYSGRSFGTMTNEPSRNLIIDAGNYFPLAEEKWQSEQSYGQVLWWWKFPNSVVPRIRTKARDARAILEEILQSIGKKGYDLPKARSSINGVIGHVNSSLKGPVGDGELLSACLQRAHSKAASEPLYQDLIKHPLFQDFLVNKIRELKR